MKFLDGKKTFILTTLGILTVVGHIFEIIDQQTMTQLLAILGFGGLAALRDGIRKQVKK